ncbi:MAG TPA: YqiA/YcfP family alpha/beta fold hydrolase [Bryobacteraceae bacterium]|nr:YqiA/YcfP family alpha/beta fold hydrolase [Bryobacteraceae bacterium]
MRIVYLHGFASSPKSSKALFFKERFAECAVPVEVPALDDGDFTGLTITRQLEVVERTVANRPATLMGSSLGGYLAALFAARCPAVEKLILMAPAFRFPSRWRELYPAAEMEEWRRKGVWPIYHFGSRGPQPLGYQLVEDSQRYEDEPEFSQPALIFHGMRDDVVPVEFSRQYASRRPNVTLRLFDSGHELSEVLEPMWWGVRRFLGIERPGSDRLG